MNRLLINGVEVDLSDSTKIGITFQINDVANLQFRSGNFSNIFKLPITAKNRKIFENVEIVGSIQQVFSEKFITDYFESDVQIVTNGIGTLESVDERYYNFRINSGNSNFFDSDSNKTVGRLYDVEENQLYALNNDDTLDYRGLFVYWHHTDIIGYNTATNYVIFPIVDLKKEFDLLSTLDLNVANLPLCLFVNDIFSRYAMMKGYKLTGSFIESNEYANLLLSPDTLTYNQEIITGVASPIPTNNIPSWTAYDFYIKEIYNEILSNSINVPAVPLGTETLQNVQMNGADTYFAKFVKNATYEPAGGYESTIGFKGSITFELSAQIDIFKNIPVPDWVVKPINGYKVDIINITTGAILFTNLYWLDNNFTTNFILNEEIVIDGVFYPEHQFRFIHTWYYKDSAEDGYQFDYSAQGYLKSIDFANEQTYGAVLFPNLLFNIKIKDLIKDVMNQFCVLSQVNEIKKEIRFFYFDDLLKEMPLDWSDKVDMNSIQISSNVGNYKRNNKFKYAPNDFVTVGSGDGSLIVDSEIDSEEETTTIELVTSATEEQKAIYQSINVPQLKLINNDWTNNESNNRLLMLDRQNVGYNINYTDGVVNNSIETNNIPFAKFLNALDFPYLLPEFYKVVNDVINNPTSVKIRLKLDAFDIKSLDFARSIYLNVHDRNISVNGRFYVSKIISFKGDLTTVELIKI